MGKQPAISIIIPAYKVEAWVERSVRSLFDQTFADFEVILVDDGGPDRTGELCDKLAAADERVRVIHQENEGAAGARNNAMKIARGDYLYFMDADDWCEPAMLADMYAMAEEHGLQLLVTGFFIDTYYGEGKFFREVRTAPQRVYVTQREFRENAHDLFDRQLLYAPWNKLYQRAYLQERGIEFPGTFWDDLPFNVDVVREVERVGCLDGRYYHFLRARAESENTRYRAGLYEKRCEEDQWLRDLFAGWDVDSPEVREFLGRRHGERLLGCVENVTCADCTLSGAEKRAAVRRIVEDPRTREALGDAEPRTTMMKVALAPLRAGNVTLTLWESRLISFVKRHSTNLFARLKANR